MSRSKDTVVVSSKGQIVIPARIRRSLGLGTGQVLRLSTFSDRRIILDLLADERQDSQALLEKAWAAARKLRAGGVEDLHRRRREEREREAAQRERRGY